MGNRQESIEDIPSMDLVARAEAEDRVQRLTKPPGSLGKLEELAVRLAAMTGNALPRVEQPGIIVFAADHGVALEGVSAFPQEVTAQMAANFAMGGAAINVFGRQIGAELMVVDAGVASELPDACRGIVRSCRVANGTGNIRREPAMTREQAAQAIQVGVDAALEMIERGIDLLIVGEMGIANTTSSAVITAAMTGRSVDELVGRGTGIDDERLGHKRQVVEDALRLHGFDEGTKASEVLDVLTKLGGFEIGAMAGAMLAAASKRVPVLLDGYICTSAALIAAGLQPLAKEYMIAGHRSEEPGHIAALKALGLEPLLDLGFRLGEGSGAAVAYPILLSATRMLREMATFESAGISGEKLLEPSEN